jgi:tetratricopeptide (TPR) repeat protein
MYIQSGNIEKALSLLESILEKDENDYDTLKLLFFIYSNSSNNEFVEKAAKIWQSLQRILFVDGKEIIIRDEELLADVAKYLETTGIQQSRKYYHDLLNLLQEKGKNASPQLLNNLAVLYHLESQEITSAYSNGYRKNYRIEVNGFDEKNLLNSLESSEALYQQALMAASAEDYVHSTEQGTVSAVQITIRYNVARLFEVLGEIEKAESHYQEILKIHPAYEDCNP